MRVLVIVFAAAMLMACSAGKQPTQINVNSVVIEDGKLSGKLSDDGIVKIFMGIPYAAPPLGELRWKSPQPIKKWEGTRECVASPASAMQAKPAAYMCWSEEFQPPVEPISEDCLYLNVWSPAKTTADKLPVIVWIHGGAFINGSGTVPLYNGEGMAKKGVIFITINYRLGIAGFFAHPELSSESEMKVSGNYGILDQIAALKWVKKNIEAFGGNPGNITIAGQSAGSFSVNVLVASPKAKGLFHKAIAQSGGNFSLTNNRSEALEAQEAKGLRVTESLGLKSIEEMRSLPAESLLSINERFGLTTDNVVIPSIYETFEKSEHNDTPLLTGWNADDGVSFGPGPSAEKFTEMARNNYGEKAERFLQLFPAATDKQAEASQKLLSQLYFGWQNYTWARMQTRKGKNPAYVYFFTHVPPGEQPYYGAFHSAEFAYALHTLKFWNRPFSEPDFQLEEIMSSYWANFAKTGNPNGEGLPEWPVFNPDKPEVMDLGDNVKAISLPHQEQLSFLDEAQ
ncbi:MAG TPA: carboxylesterase family protein [Bacteroidales bacterium]|nr:carboxylesterase family protein [Bacteroidales bacterium]